MSKKKINVLIIDDDTIARQGTVYILSKTDTIQVSGEAGDCSAGLKLLREHRFDIVLLDLFMQGKDPLDFVKEVKTAFPELPVLLLTTSDEDGLAIRFIKAGVSGYITKDAALEHLPAAIEKVASGGKYLVPHMAEKLAYHSFDEPLTLHDALSDREYQVLILIASGKAPADIAKELCISPKTVSTYRTAILEKMKMKNNAELMFYCLKRELIRSL